MQGAQADARAAKPTQPQFEYFTWRDMRFDITKLLKAIEARKIRPSKEVLDKAFIEQYAEKVLCLKKDRPEVPVYSFLLTVDSPRAYQMPDSVLQQAVIIGYVGKNKGLLNLDGTGAHYVIIDGNHRMGKAYFSEVEQVNAYVLSELQMRQYKER